MNVNIDFYYQKRYTIFKRIHNASNVEKLGMAFLMACLTGLLAQIILPLPWTPVPITGQTFGALISGLFLGKRFGVLSQIIYILGGILGINWFAEMTSGLSIFLGSTFGYFIGFIFAAAFIGHMSEKYAQSRKFKKMSILMLIANFGCIYIPGLIGLGVWIYFTQGTFPDIITLIMMGLAPFVIGDLFKIWGAATLSKVVLPK
ncbi:MAG: biotin transporter BioY [Methanobacteriaceae archaeon]|jgi:biotin transport system substrate-specific component|nr:biotin transporter BioY [Candidatus Methanorudis spinitermitis]